MYLPDRLVIEHPSQPPKNEEKNIKEEKTDLHFGIRENIIVLI